MSVILHHDGAYQLWSTIVDGPLFETAITLEQLKHHVKEEFGRAGLVDLESRLERAHATGTSSRVFTLEETIDSMMNPPLRLTKDEFIERFLTI